MVRIVCWLMMVGKLERDIGCSLVVELDMARHDKVRCCDH